MAHEDSLVVPERTTSNRALELGPEVEGLVQAMGLTGMSKSQVSELAKGLNQMVESFRNRPLDQSPYTSLDPLDANEAQERPGTSWSPSPGRCCVLFQYKKYVQMRLVG